MLHFALGIILGILILWYLISTESMKTNHTIENYRSCGDCDLRMPVNGVAVVNPFIWPYSGTPCVDDLYILNKDAGLDLGFGSGPLTHLNTPDHVVLTN